MNLGSQRCCINNNIKGNTGTKGNIGPYGPIGPIGLTGTTGNTGLIGDTGLCYRGRQGTQGPVGAQGGLTGNAGPIGPVGSSGTDLAQNVHFTFTTNNSASYSSAGYTDLTNLTSQTLINNISLASGTYSINWEIFEGWTDSGNKFCVIFNNVVPTYSTVFTETNPLVLLLNPNISKMYGIGNDVVTFSSNDTYTIKLLQSTTSGSIINIPSKTVNFSITFIKLP